MAKNVSKSPFLRLRTQQHGPCQAAELHQHLGENDVVPQSALCPARLATSQLQVRSPQSAVHKLFASEKRFSLVERLSLQILDAEHASRRTLLHRLAQLLRSYAQSGR